MGIGTLRRYHAAKAEPVEVESVEDSTSDPAGDEQVVGTVSLPEGDGTTGDDATDEQPADDTEATPEADQADDATPAPADDGDEQAEPETPAKPAPRTRRRK